MKFESSPGPESESPDAAAEAADTAEEKDATDGSATDDKPAKDADVVSLDAFRK